MDLNLINRISDVWLLCEYDFPIRVATQLQDKGLTLRDIKEMNYDKFCDSYSMKDEFLYDQITLFSKLKDVIRKIEEANEFSKKTIYALVPMGFEYNIVNLLIFYKISLVDLTYYTVEHLSEKFRYDEELLTQLKKAANLYLFGTSDRNIYEEILSEIMFHDGVSPSYLVKKLDLKLDTVEVGLDQLFKRRLIKYSEKGIVSTRPKLDDIIGDMQSSRNKDIFLRRLSGMTYRAIGEEFHISTQRVVQICKKIVSKFPLIEEDKYAHLFKCYEFSEKLFCDLFNETKKTYYYLCARYDKGTNAVTVEEIKKFARVNSGYVKKLEKKCYIKIDGQEIKRNKKEVMAYVAAKMNEYFTLEELVAYYNKKIKGNNDLSVSKLTLLNYYHNYDLINCNFKKYKYFVVNKILIDDLVNIMGLKSFHNTLISTKKLFSLHQDFLEEKGIKDEYELHNILKIGLVYRKYRKDVKIKFLRMPLLQFGDIEKDTLVKQCIYDKSPIKVNEFYEYMYEQFGFKKDTFKAYLLSKFSSYMQDDYLIVDVHTPLDQDIICMKNLLDKDFYFIDEYRKLIKQNHLPKDYFSKRYVEAFGYHKRSKYILKKSYDTAYSYFKQIIMEKDTFDLDTIDKRYTLISTFDLTIDDLEAKLELFRIDSRKYISKERIENEKKMDQAFIKTYISKMCEITSNHYFTVDWLINHGLEECFRKQGFKDIIYTSLFKSCHDIKGFRFDDVWVFKKNDTPLNKIMFIKDIVNKEGTMLISDLVELLEKDYGIKCNCSKLKDLIKNSDLYYDVMNEKVGMIQK